MTNHDEPRLILGSGSPRRLELLAVLGITPHDVRPPDIDETPLKGELPRPYCKRVTQEKLAAVVHDAADVALCADTTVALGRRILGKPENEAEAAKFLHRGDQVWVRDVVTNVKMKPLSDDEISAYIRSGEWQGKAGGYTIQGRGGAFIPWISGAHSAVMGLPLSETYTLLQAAGLPVPLDAP